VLLGESRRASEGELYAFLVRTTHAAIRQRLEGPIEVDYLVKYLLKYKIGSTIVKKTLDYGKFVGGVEDLPERGQNNAAMNRPGACTHGLEIPRRPASVHRDFDRRVGSTR
jgi:hypothetical protein